jgi:hypothetical protein
MEVCTNKGPGPLQRRENHKKCKNRVGSSKNHLLKNHQAKKVEIYIKASRYSANSRLYKSWSPGVRWGHNEEKHFSICQYWKTKFFRTNRPISINFGTDHFCIKGIEFSTNKGQGPLQRGCNCKKCKNTVV